MSKTKTQSKSMPSTDESIAPFHGRPWVIGIIMLYLIFAVAYNVVTPADPINQHNPDENGHLQYVQMLASGHLPVFRNAIVEPEFHQPPLYYLLCLPVYLATKGMGFAASMHAVRAVSTLLGILLIFVTYRCVRRLFPREGWAAVLATGFVALLPMNVAMNASVGNDSLTNLLAAVGLMLLIKIATSDERSIQKAVLLGIVLGLIILTKSSALVLYPVVLFTFAILGYRKVLTPSTAFRYAAIAVVLGAVIGSPWLIRNSVLYGDPLGQKLFLKSFGHTPQADSFIRVLGFGGYEGLVANWTFASFWGVFDQMTAWWGRDPHARGYPSIDAPLLPIYEACLVLSFVAIFGVFLYLKRSRPTPSQSSMLWSMLLLILATGYGFMMFTMQYFQAQGRYWFTSLVPFALFFALGLRGVFPRDTWHRAASIALIVGFAALNAYTIWGLLFSHFAPLRPVF